MSGQPKVVRIRELKSGMGFFTLITYGVYELGARKPILKSFLTRGDAAKWVEAQGWRYLGPQS